MDSGSRSLRLFGQNDRILFLFIVVFDFFKLCIDNIFFAFGFIFIRTCMCTSIRRSMSSFRLRPLLCFLRVSLFCYFSRSLREFFCFRFN